jgi:hypothetical protein
MKKEIYEVITPPGVAKLKTIAVLLNQAEALFASLSNVERDAILDFHHVDSSLNHCLRWGPQAALEILSEINGN